jgi:hypothetical protein
MLFKILKAAALSAETTASVKLGGISDPLSCRSAFCAAVKAAKFCI